MSEKKQSIGAKDKAALMLEFSKRHLKIILYKVFQ